MQRSLVLLAIDSNWQFDVMLQALEIDCLPASSWHLSKYNVDDGQDIDEEVSKRCNIANRLGWPVILLSTVYTNTVGVGSTQAFAHSISMVTGILHFTSLLVAM